VLCCAVLCCAVLCYAERGGCCAVLCEGVAVRSGRVAVASCCWLIVRCDNCNLHRRRLRNEELRRMRGQVMFLVLAYCRYVVRHTSHTGTVGHQPLSSFRIEFEAATNIPVATLARSRAMHVQFSRIHLLSRYHRGAIPCPNTRNQESRPRARHQQCRPVHQGGNSFPMYPNVK
jgi:hypothetical protein